MKAVYFDKNGSHSDVLQVGELPKPSPGDRDLLVRVQAAGVNPVDYKQVLGAFVPLQEGKKGLVGFDCCGVVEAVGSKCSKFKVGQEVYFAGDLSREGSFAEYTLVQEDIVAAKPKNLDSVKSATLPLVTLTAWESIFEEMGVEPSEGVKKDANGQQKKILIIGGAGGVGSIAVQLAKYAGLYTIATASRPETVAYVKDLGADAVFSHRASSYKDELVKLGVADGAVDYIFATAGLDSCWDQVCAILKPFSRIVTTLPPSSPLNVAPLFMMRASLHSEMMFSRPMFGADPSKQGEILTRMAALIDAGKVRHTCTKEYDLWKEHMQALDDQASGKMMGKIGLSVAL
eukprot:Nk52_evm6s2612 gene=Nk52_evmTU6s2612